jgi:hypothetical protein
MNEPVFQANKETSLPKCPGSILSSNESQPPALSFELSSMSFLSLLLSPPPTADPRSLLLNVPCPFHIFIVKMPTEKFSCNSHYFPKEIIAPLELIPTRCHDTSLRSSRGLITPCPPCCSTCVYIMVVATSLCPNNAWMVLISVPR